MTLYSISMFYLFPDLVRWRKSPLWLCDLYGISLFYLFPDLVRWRKSPPLWLCDFIQYIFVLFVSRLGKVEEVAAAVAL